MKKTTWLKREIKVRTIRFKRKIARPFIKDKVINEWWCKSHIKLVNAIFKNRFELRDYNKWNYLIEKNKINMYLNSKIAHSTSNDLPDPDPEFTLIMVMSNKDKIFSIWSPEGCPTEKELFKDNLHKKDKKRVFKKAMKNIVRNSYNS